MNRYVILIGAVLALIVVLSLGLRKDPSVLPSPFINKEAPAFDLPTVEDLEMRISKDDLLGRKTLVNVWATWCVGCRQEHAYLMHLASTGAIPIYGINWRDNRDDALRWLQEYGDPYVASGFDGDARVGIDWGVYGAPETFLVDEHGIVLHKHLGPLTAASWQRDFVPLLQETGPAQ